MTLVQDVAREVFNRCSEGNDTKDGAILPDSKDYNVTFNYEFLEDFRDDEDDVCDRFRYVGLCKNMQEHVSSKYGYWLGEDTYSKN